MSILSLRNELDTLSGILYRASKNNIDIRLSALTLNAQTVTAAANEQPTRDNLIAAVTALRTAIAQLGIAQ